MAPDNRLAVCPGTFDPVTNGHLDVIRRASAMFDEVIVGVVNIPWRKGGTVFTAEERVRLSRTRHAS
jgi:pantetheine-phosphate adenylyltransferase